MTYPRRSLLALLCLCALTSCSATKAPTNSDPISGAKSGVLTQQYLTNAAIHRTRNSALLGLFLSEYLSYSLLSTSLQGAIDGIAANNSIVHAQQNIHDPDYVLLQAFAEALQVDVTDLLNRSPDRHKSLQLYVGALTSVAEKSNSRYNELTLAEETLKETLRTQSKDRADADKALKNAISKKEFSDAAELQKKVLATQQAFAETDLKSKQIQNVVDTFEKMLTLYGEKILAIEQNREVLIAGNKVVDVPGVEELEILQRQKGSRKGNKGFDSLFQTQ